MQGQMEAEGRIVFGPLPWDISERLAGFQCSWLEFVPQENSVVVRRQLPSGCPAVTGIPCEVITLLDAIPPEVREKIPGGALHIRDSEGRIMRLVVEAGEVRIQWPRADYSRSVPLPAEAVLSSEGDRPLRVTGWVRFAGAPERRGEIETFVGRFGGVFPEGDMPSECRQAIALIRLKDAEAVPRPLLDAVRALADPPESFSAELEFHSVVTDAAARRFRIVARDGKIEALRPALWDPLPA